MDSEKSPVGEIIANGINRQQEEQKQGLKQFQENCRQISLRVGGLIRWLPGLADASSQKSLSSR